MKWTFINGLHYILSIIISQTVNRTYNVVARSKSVLSSIGGRVSEPAHWISSDILDILFYYDMICFDRSMISEYTLKVVRTPQLLKQKKLMQTQEDHSNPILALNVDSLKVDLVVIQNTCSEKEDSNSETASSKSVKESSLDYATKDVHAIKYKMSKAKER
ncbi:hypothetical protein Tco_0418660 [Tanacetum coccineum]